MRQLRGVGSPLPALRGFWGQCQAISLRWQVLLSSRTYRLLWDQFFLYFFFRQINYFFLICICMFVCGYAHGSAGTFRGQRMLSPLVLELDSCESPDTGAGNWTLGFLRHWIFSLAHLSVLFRRASVHRICLAFLHVSREVWKRPLSNHPGLTAWFIDLWDCTSIFLLESSVVGLVLSSLVSGGEKPSLPARRCKVLTFIALAW